MFIIYSNVKIGYFFYFVDKGLEGESDRFCLISLVVVKLGYGLGRFVCFVCSVYVIVVFYIGNEILEMLFLG